MIGTMPDRRPGEGRYAKLEREQRWLVPTVPERAGRGTVIEDRYVTGTRLRLRRAEGTSGVLHKLAQKVRPAEGGGGPERVKITNLYLSEDEAAVLRQLPAAVLRKHRWPVRHDGRAYAVDEHLGRLAGLVLAETTLDEAEPRLPLPPFALREVTDDERFSGGWLAHASDAEAAALLAEVVEAPGMPRG